jgi:hypothetical protein
MDNNAKSGVSLYVRFSKDGTRKEKKSIENQNKAKSHILQSRPIIQGIANKRPIVQRRRSCFLAPRRKNKRKREENKNAMKSKTGECSGLHLSN